MRLTTFYHVTAESNVPSILEKGLVFEPRPGSHGVYLFDNRVAAWSAIGRALRAHRCEWYKRQPLVILGVHLPRSWPLFEDPADYAPAYYSPISIPAWRVSSCHGPYFTRRGGE